MKKRYTYKKKDAIFKFWHPFLLNGFNNIGVNGLDVNARVGSCDNIAKILGHGTLGKEVTCGNKVNAHFGGLFHGIITD